MAKTKKKTKRPASSKPARKKTRRSKPRKTFEYYVSRFVSVLIFIGLVAGIYYGVRVLSNRAQTSQESIAEEEIVYGSLPRVDTRLQMEKIRQASAGQVVDAAGLEEEDLKSLFSAQPLDDELLSKMEGITWSEDQDFIDSDDLVLLRVLHKNFEGQDQLGELIVNKSIAMDTLNAFFEIYQEEYQIEKMLPLDEYDGDLELSRTDNNTSAFSIKLKNSDGLKKNSHSLGMALDLNPFYNPSLIENGVYPVFPYASQIYMDRDLKEERLEANHMISAVDKAYQILKKYGFSWAGQDKPASYQLFEYKGKGTNTKDTFTLSSHYDAKLLLEQTGSIVPDQTPDESQEEPEPQEETGDEWIQETEEVTEDPEIYLPNEEDFIEPEIYPEYGYEEGFEEGFYEEEQEFDPGWAYY